jgi:hypothetical protein
MTNALLEDEAVQAVLGMNQKHMPDFFWFYCSKEGDNSCCRRLLLWFYWNEKSNNNYCRRLLFLVCNEEDDNSSYYRLLLWFCCV